MAFWQAPDQKEAEDMMRRQGRGEKETVNQQQIQCCFGSGLKAFVAAAGHFEKHALPSSGGEVLL